MNRRWLLKAGGSVAAVGAVAGGLAAYRFVPSSPRQALKPTMELAQDLLGSVGAWLRESLQVEYDHPYG